MNRRRWLQIGVTVGSLLVAAFLIDFQQAARAVQSVDVVLLLAAAPFEILAVCISAKLWATTVRAKGYRGPFRSLLVYYYITQFFSTFIPSSFGGDSARAYYFTRDNPEMKGSVSSIVTERLTGLVSLLLVAGLASLLAPSGLLEVRYWLAFVLLAGVLFGVALLAFPTALDAIVRTITAKIPQIGQKLHAFYEELMAYREMPEVLVTAFVWSLAFRLAVIAGDIMVAWAVGVQIPIIYFFIVIPIAELLLALPISINGLGVREVSLGVLFAAFGVPFAEGVLVGLGIYLSNLVFNSLPGGLVYVAYQSRFGDSKPSANH